MKSRDAIPNRIRLAVYHGWLLAWLLFAPGLVVAQSKKPAEKGPAKSATTAVPKITADSTVSKASLDAKIKAVKDNESLKKEVKEPALKLYDDAGKQLDAAETSRKKMAEYESLRKNVEKATEDVAKEIKKPIEDPDPDLNGTPTLADYEALLAKAKAELQSARAASLELEKHQQLRRERQTLIPKRLEDAKKELKTVQAALTAKGVPNDAPETVEAQRAFQQTRLKALDAEIAELEAELLYYDASKALLPLQIRAASRRVQRAERAVALWTKSVERSRENEAEAQEREARDLLERVRKLKLPQDVVQIAEENLKMARDRTGASGTVARIRKSVGDLTTTDADIQRIKKDQKTLEDKLKIAGIEDVIGPQVQRMRRQLPNIGRIQRRIAGRRRDLSQVYLDVLREDERAKNYVNVETSIKQLVESISTKQPDVDRMVLKDQVEAAIKQRQKLLDSLVKDYNSLHTNLGDLNANDQQLINAAKELQQLIDKHILWIPSTSPLEFADLGRCREAIGWLLSGENWTETWKVFKASVFARPIVSALAVFLLALVLLKESDMKSRLREFGEQAAKGFTAPYPLTIKALFLTVMLSATWPSLLWFVGWHLETYTDTTDFAVAVANALQAVGAVLLTLEFLRRMFRPRGLAEAHFRWRDTRMQMFRRNLRWYAALVLPGVFVFTMIDDVGNETYGRSLGRLTLIGLLFVASGFLALVLRKPRPKKAASAAAADHDVAATHTNYLRVAAYAAAVIFPIAFAILAGSGYLYTASLLMWKLTETAWLSIVLIVLHAMAIRWLYHARGKLALERVQAAAAVAAAAAADPNVQPAAPATGESGDGSTTRPTDKPTPEAAATAAVDRESKQKTAAEIATINAQTKRLLRILVGSSAVVGLWLIWVEVLPALKFLEYPLWSSQVEVTKMVADQTGRMVAERKPTLKLFTLGDAMIAVTVLVVAFIAAANLPGLLEVAVLQKLPIDSGARYAASSMARYGIYAIGIMYGFSLAGIGWGKVQWLVAALSVGIGFGLQEIVANFISGIILLFERPLRVGDVVSVGDVTGTVARIQIRATTVRDWDRKEYIIPNKELVTGKFMNWTLSDSVNRIVIKVGVAYGSDADLVQRILMDVAKSQPDVLDEPAPHALFDGFGDSSLNFVLRCCLPSLDKRLPAMHYLHAEIHRRLAEAGIEIPFPQRDLHIRSDDTHGNGQFNGKKRERETADDYKSASLS